MYGENDIKIAMVFVNIICELEVTLAKFDKCEVV